METTEPSLLERVRDRTDADAWCAFDAKYRELILRYCRARGLQTADAEDALQVALLALVGSLPRFRYEPRRGRFRSYLGAVVRSAVARVTDRRRPPRPLSRSDLERLADDRPQDALWDREWVGHHYRSALANVRSEFARRSVELFELLCSGASVRSVAERFGVSAQSVHKVKQRIRSRLRARIAEQIDEEERTGRA